MAQKRNPRSGVEDRWTKSIRDAHGNVQSVRSANYGKGMRWRARFIDDNGAERAKGFQRKSDAQKFLDSEVTAKLVTGTYIEPSAGRVTVSAVYQTWFAAQSHISAKTAASRRSVWNSRVEPHWGDVLVADVRSSAVRGWVAAMVAEGTGTPIIENAFGVLRQVLGAAVEDNRIARNPCDGVKLPKRKHADRGYLSHEQVAALASQVERDPEVVRFLAYTGLRWGEMAALRVQDFDMLRRRVNVSRSVTESGGLQWSTPKSWERRSVPFPAVLAEELASLMIGKARDHLVFTDLRGGVLRNSNWRTRVFRPAVQRCQAVDASFPTITPHDLRHTAASLAVSVRANVKAVQRMLGHAKASMTLDTYADLFDEDLDEVADRLDAAIQLTADALRTAEVP
ncbi:tyrosine-type recombinase/integrase [Mycobacterium marseillense]|uniref:Site-specific integrase n=1 Tax=Mycobacterium marseillense TaxID=701042 RepID=A0ABM7JIL1_9MYCO|nr:site-specific integrase [Mycobacterium marseillense]MCV7406419.1 site-specific integrase [Mycobacterium marseillense]ORA93643.1 site-specific integrase [Mycobacterium marseillense]BBY13822.1 site-specific integrase [Mycobacterium marseillense]